MAIQHGRGFLVQYSADDTSYTTLPAQTALKLSFQDSIIDVTSKNSNGIRELLEELNEYSIKFTVSGNYDDITLMNTLESKAKAATFGFYKIVFPGANAGLDKKFKGKITDLSYDAPKDGAATYSMTVEGSGDDSDISGS